MNGNSENGRVGRLRREECQKNMPSENGRVCRLRREKCQKNGNPENMRFRMLLFECTFVMPIPREENLRSMIVFRMFLKTFSFTKQCSLRSFTSLAAGGAEGFRSLRSLPFSEEPKRIRQKSLGSLPKTE